MAHVFENSKEKKLKLSNTKPCDQKNASSSAVEGFIRNCIGTCYYYIGKSSFTAKQPKGDEDRPYKNVEKGAYLELAKSIRNVIRMKVTPLFISDITFVPWSLS